MITAKRVYGTYKLDVRGNNMNYGRAVCFGIHIKIVTRDLTALVIISVFTQRVIS